MSVNYEEMSVNSLFDYEEMSVNYEEMSVNSLFDYEEMSVNYVNIFCRLILYTHI
jgi:hypothetical protein